MCIGSLQKQRRLNNAKEEGMDLLLIAMCMYLKTIGEKFRNSPQWFLHEQVLKFYIKVSFYHCLLKFDTKVHCMVDIYKGAVIRLPHFFNSFCLSK